jgi:drug/metabolite transporter (DMT)-like permease
MAKDEEQEGCAAPLMIDREQIDTVRHRPCPCDIDNTVPGDNNQRWPLLGGIAALSSALCMAGYVLTSELLVGKQKHETAGFLLLRQSLASLVLCLLAAARTRCYCIWPSPRVQRDLMILGLLNCVNAIFFLEGLLLTGSFVATVCQLTIPVLTFVYATASHIEEASPRRALAMITIVVGCGLAAYGHGVQDGAVAFGRFRHFRRTLLGVSLLLVQCTSFVGIVVVQQRVLQQHPVSLVVAWGYVLSTLWTLVYAVATGAILRLGSQLSSPTDAASLAFAAVFGAAVYFELIATAVKHLTPTLVTCFVALEPLLVSAIGGVVFGHSTSSLEHAGYLCAAVGAVAMAVRPASRSTARCTFSRCTRPDGHGLSHGLCDY